MALLKEAGRYRHYAHHVVFLETICKQIPIFAKNLGKKIFKNIAEDFFDIIFYSLVMIIIFMGKIPGLKQIIIMMMICG
mgnify:FL=1